MRPLWIAAVVLAGCHTEGLEGAPADTVVGAYPLAALPWGLPALVLGVIAGFYARPEGRTGARQKTTGILTILALIAAGVCARAMMGPPWQLGYGILFGAFAIAGLAFGRLWNPAQRAMAIAIAAGLLIGVAAAVIAVRVWSWAMPYYALAFALVAGTIGVVIARRVKR